MPATVDILDILLLTSLQTTPSRPWEVRILETHACLNPLQPQHKTWDNKAQPKTLTPDPKPLKPKPEPNSKAESHNRSWLQVESQFDHTGRLRPGLHWTTFFNSRSGVQVLWKVSVSEALRRLGRNWDLQRLLERVQTVAYGAFRFWCGIIKSEFPKIGDPHILAWIAGSDSSGSRCISSCRSGGRCWVCVCPWVLGFAVYELGLGFIGFRV